MSEFKGTKGPWSVSANTSVDSELGGFICEAYGDSTSFEQDQANAKLIAAAPELLDALQQSMKIWENHRLDVSEASILIDCRAAIAKALGQ